jgi:uncharacterized protein with NRDE domain
VHDLQRALLFPSADLAMCLAAIASGLKARFPWVLASNRDEFFDRAAAPLSWWQPAAGAEPVLGGRDLSAGGTWLALQRNGRLALVTNVREPGRHLAIAPSRGDLVLQWLRRAELRAQPEQLLHPPRNGFNLLGVDLALGGQGLWLSNRGGPAQVLGTGVHGLSNAALDTPWPKVTQLKRRLGEVASGATDAQALVGGGLALLADRRTAPDAELPCTGVPLERERALSALCIRITEPGTDRAVYGTRCSTVAVLEQRGEQRRVHVRERTLDALGQVHTDVSETFEVNP